MLTEKRNLVKKFSLALEPLNLNLVTSFREYYPHIIKELESGNYQYLHVAILFLFAARPDIRLGCFKEDTDCKLLTQLLFECYLKMFWKKSAKQREKTAAELTKIINQELIPWLSS